MAQHKTLRNWILSSISMLLFVYFVFHSIYGERGVIAYFKWQHNLSEKQTELDEVRSEKLELEHKVKLLRTDSLDKDMLDEQARKVLGVSKPDEQVFMVTKEDAENE